MAPITGATLAKIFLRTNRPTLDAWAAPLTDACHRFGIDTPARVAAFIAQIGHESGGLTRTAEGLFYTAERLTQVWPSRFPTIAAATPYARNPEKLANRVYAGRLGNGNEASGDGYRFRGRGLIQLTGRENYTAFAKAMGFKLDDAPAYLETKAGAANSAAWFWSTHGLNTPADARDVRAMTLKINGGLVGLADRTALYRTSCAACGVA